MLNRNGLISVSLVIEWSQAVRDPDLDYLSTLRQAKRMSVLFYTLKVAESGRTSPRREERYGRFPKTLIFAVNDLPHTSHADKDDMARLRELWRASFGGRGGLSGPWNKRSECYLLGVRLPDLLGFLPVRGSTDLSTDVTGKVG